MSRADWSHQIDVNVAVTRMPKAGDGDAVLPLELGSEMK
jgi:hypothetical protein